MAAVSISLQGGFDPSLEVVSRCWGLCGVEGCSCDPACLGPIKESGNWLGLSLVGSQRWSQRPCF